MNDRPRRSSFRSTISTGLKPATDVISLGRRHKPDYSILTLMAIMLTIGLVVVYSISPGLAASQHISQNYFITKQLIDVALGIAAFCFAAYLPPKFWQKSAKPLAIAAAIGCLLVMVTPIDEVYQAHRWIRLGGFSFQVAELIKLALILWLAGFLTNRWRESKIADFNETIKPLLIIILALGVVVAKLQSDLGSAGVMIAIIGAMAFSIGVPLKKIALVVGLVAVLLVVAVASSSYRRDRLETFLHPEASCQDSGYQACQALIAVGSGGIFGLGLGYSVQAYGYLPEASNDSIFAIMAEKFGFIGSLLLITLYGLFITRLKRIIERTADQFSRLILVGVLAWLSTQMIINIGAMIGLLPLKGITLPLISQGGTSLVFLMAALGLVFQISRYTSYDVTEPKNNQNNQSSNGSSDRWRVRRPHNPHLVARPRT